MLRALSVMATVVVLALAPKGWCQETPEPTPPAEAQQEIQAAADESGSSAEQAPAPSDELTVAAVEASLERARAAEELDEATRTRVVELLAEAAESLRRAGQFAERAAEFRASGDAAPDRMEAIRAQLAEPAPEAVVEARADATLSSLEQQLQEATAELNRLRESETSLQDERGKRSERRAAIPDRLTRARAELASIEEDLGELAPAEGEAERVFEAKRTALRARGVSREREIEALSAELASYEARQKLLPLRLDLETRRVQTAEALEAGWREVVSERRRQEAQAAAAVAEQQRREAARSHPVLQAFAAESQRLAAERVGDDGLLAKLDRAVARTTSLSADLRRLREGYAGLDRRLRVSGLSRASGLMLRREFESLRSESLLHREVREIEDALDAAEFRLLELQESRTEGGNVDGALARLMDQVRVSGVEATEAVEADLLTSARELVVARRDLLDELISDEASYLERLAEQEAVARTLLMATRAYSEFIEERILWVRSIPAGYFGGREGFRDAYAWYLDEDAWLGNMRRVPSLARERWGQAAFGLALVIGLIAVRRPIRRMIQRRGELASSYRTDRFGLTLEVVALTALTSLRLPLLLWAMGWVFVSVGPDDAVDAIGRSLRMIAPMVVPFEFLKHATIRGGLAEVHLRWPKAAIPVVHRNVRWFLLLAIPIGTISRSTTFAPSEPVQATIGRFMFTLSAIVVSLFLHAILRPWGPVFRDWLSRRTTSWVYRLRYVWYGAMVATMPALSVAGWLGYFYTASMLGRQFGISLALALGLVVVQGLLLRWLFLARRRVALESARRRREAARAESGEEQGTESPAIDVEELDLPAISAQTRQVFGTVIWVSALLGLFAVWANVMPALRMLDRVQVWPSVQVVETKQLSGPDILRMGTVATADQPAARTAPEPAPDADEAAATVPAMPGSPAAMLATPAPAAADRVGGDLAITLLDVGVFTLTLIATWVAFRNLPGLIEILILQRVPLDAGARYALLTVFRYLIAFLGVAIAFSALGMTWSKLQWLAAALTFGLAFGLQEIFANFVSGLIILWERPFRVGDTVTVNSVSGTVTRIQPRATTIRDWDRKELVIPNKSFITGDVINWTLSDNMLRIIIPVGVSYGADVRLVEKTLVEIAAANPTVMKDPPPRSWFLGFGDSSLAFDVRVFVPHVDHLLQVKHDLHMAITERFRELGIEIAFPQLDLHIRTGAESAEAFGPGVAGAQG